MSRLQLSNTPALDVPARFFLTAPLFGVAAAGGLAWGGGEAIAGRWSPSVLAITHLLTLGFMTTAMIGALLQVIPVLMGEAIPGGRGLATMVHLTLSLGTALLVAGWLLPDLSWVTPIALVLLAVAMIPFLTAAALGLSAARGKPTSRLAVGAALTALLLTAVLGLLLAAGHAGGIGLGLDRRWTDLHAVWGLLGWAGLLVVGLAYEVVPMFQSTPSYPGWLRRWLSAALLAALAIWAWALAAVRHGGGPGWAIPLWVAGIAVVLAFGVFAWTTLRLQLGRKRPEPDLTLWYWRTGMLCLIAGLATGTAVLAVGADPRWVEVAAALILVGFAVSVINGMLFKILPFLVWLHLTIILPAEGRSRREVPAVQAILPRRTARAQFLLHLLALALLCAALAHPDDAVTRAAALAMGASFVLLEWVLLAGLRRYCVIRDHCATWPMRGRPRR